MSEPTTPTETVADPLTQPDSFMSTIDNAFGDIGSFEEVETPEIDLGEVGDVDNGDGGDGQTTPTDGQQTEEDELGIDIDTEVDVTDWSPEAARAFKQVRNELKTERQALRQLNETLEQRENRIKELEAISPDVETLRQKLDEYESKLLVTRVEDTEAYKALVEAPLRDIVTQSDQLAEKYGVNPDELFGALTLTDEAAQEEAIADLLASASERDRFKAYQLIEQLKPIEAQRTALRENSQEALREIQELEQLRQQEAAAQRLEQRRDLAARVSDRIVSKLDFIKQFEGVDMQAIVKGVESTDPSLLPPVQSVYNQIAAELFPKIAREYVKMTRERDGLLSKLADYDRATPRVGGQPNNIAGQPSNPDLSFVDAINRQFGG